MIHKLISP